MNRRLGIAIAVVLAAAGVGVGLSLSSSPPHSKTTAPVTTTTSPRVKPPTDFTPPASLSHNCSKDVTAELDYFFYLTPKSATVELPKNACYLVSNSDASLLTIANKSGLTVNGNNAQFKQNSYAGNGDVAPILSLTSDTGLTVNNLVLVGPGGAGGQEGDVGLMVTLDTDLTVNGLIVTGTDGDGVDVYAGPGQFGINRNVVLNHLILANIGYHAIVPESAKGLLIENSTITSGDIDAEVDGNCQGQSPSSCGGTVADPAGDALVNFTLNNDSFPNGLSFEDGMSCLPIANWAFTNDNFGTGGIDLQFDTASNMDLSDIVNDPAEDAANGWSSSLCAPQSGLTISGNKDTGQSLPNWGGSGSSWILVQQWHNVAITGNDFTFDPNFGCVGWPVTDLWSDVGVKITGNTFNDMIIDHTDTSPSDWPPDTGIVDSGNTHRFLNGATCG